jgi:predicted metal-dependent HD superfamily phosphohydrolase
MSVASKQRWLELWHRMGAKSDPEDSWRMLHAAYTESWRAYHNLSHICHCLAEFDNISLLAANPDAMEAAIWFHDVIYDTHRTDNEERSADFAVAVLGSAKVAPSYCAMVRTLILATKHNVTPLDHDARLLVDVDLSIFGQSPELYAGFEDQIRREYAWVSDHDFSAGRSSVLIGFLDRPRVFSTETFQARYEERARINLAWAIGRLKR